jgi:hypothetical protein
MKGVSMPVTVNLTLRGLCALVPPEPIGDRLSQLQILVPDVRDGATVGPFTICPHSPVVKFGPSSSANRQWNFAGEEELELLKASDRTPPAGGISLLPEFKSVIRMARAAQTEPLQLDLKAYPVIAALALSAGSMKGVEIKEEVEFRASAAGPGHYRDRFAHAVLIEILLEDETAVVFREARPNGREIELQPSGGKSAVDITIENLCKPSEAPHGEEPDADFAIYYKFLKGYTGEIFVPFPVHGSPRGADEVVAEAVHPGGCFPEFMST